jgi:hypothetical protein
MAGSDAIVPGAAAPDGKEEVIFNHDLLMNPGDVEKARALYPEIAEFLDWPELRASFARHDAAAKAGKQRYLRRGAWAVALGVLALSIAACEPRLHALHEISGADTALSALVLGLSVASLVCGHAFMYGRLKDGWLHHRAAAELLRQLHFQWIARCSTRIAAASRAKDKLELKQERDRQLVRLNERLEPGREAVVDRIVNDLAGRWAWQVDRQEDVAPATDAATHRLDQLLTAYRDLRLQHQSGFAMKTQGEGRGFWPWQVKGQEERFVAIATLLTIIVVAAHLLVAIFTPLFGKDGAGLVGWTQSFAMVAAIAALGIRIFEDGMRTRFDVARYRRYGGDAAELEYRFATAKPDDRFGVMERLEEVSYRELRDFLTDHRDASFLL